MLFGGGDTVFGMPLLYVYVSIAWLLIIGAVAWIAERRTARRRQDAGG
jgi:hypothetical protein